MTEPRSNAGFTLLEVLVALAVLAIALAAVIQVGVDNAYNAGYLRDKTFAHWVAMNQIAQLRIEEQWPSTGERDGDSEMGGQEWRWEAEIVETFDDAIRRVEIRVFRAEERDHPLVHRTGFLPEPKQ